MVYNNFKQLSFTEQKLYHEIIQKIELYQKDWLFRQIPFDTVVKVYRAVLDDHPEYFWLNGASKGTTSTLGAQFSVTFEPEYQVPVGRIPAMRRQFDALAEALVRRAKSLSPTLYFQVLFLHDYLVKQTDYQLNAPHCYDAYGCLILHRAVCAGYAAAFQVLMQKLGVECGRVTGWAGSARTGEVSHAWNYIRLSDGYYYVDVTWDDPIMDNRTAADNLSHDYFCLDLQEMRLTHRFEPDQFIPISYGTEFNYYRYRGWYLESYSFPAVRSLAEKQLRQSGEFSVKFGSKRALELAQKDLFDSQKVYTILGVPPKLSYTVSRSGLILTVTRR